MACSFSALASWMSVMYASSTVRHTGTGCDCVPLSCNLLLVISDDRVLLFVGADFRMGSLPIVHFLHGLFSFVH